MIVVIVIILVAIIAFLLWGAVLNSKADRKLRNEGFNPTIKIGILQIDEEKKIWAIYGSPQTYPLTDIVDCEVIEDGVSYKSDHGVLRAVVGGALFGAAGAIVGASTASSSEYINSIQVAIWRKDSLKDHPIKISLLNSKTSKNSIQYKTSKQLAETLVKLLDKYSGFSEKKAIEQSSTMKQQEALQINSSVADELEKYKKLLDTGVITQAEFDEAKSKLLSKL